MYDRSSPDRDGMPTDLWAMAWALPVLVVVTVAITVAYVLDVSGVTGRSLLWCLAVAGVLVTYYAARIVHVNQCYVGDPSIDSDVRAAARSTRNRWLTWTVVAAAVTAFLLSNLGLF